MMDAQLICHIDKTLCACLWSTNRQNAKFSTPIPSFLCPIDLKDDLLCVNAMQESFSCQTVTNYQDEEAIWSFFSIKKSQVSYSLVNEYLITQERKKNVENPITMISITYLYCIYVCVCVYLGKGSLYYFITCHSHVSFITFFLSSSSYLMTISNIFLLLCLHHSTNLNLYSAIDGWNF